MVNINTIVDISVTRSSFVVEAVKQSLIIFSILFIFHHFLRKMLENPKEKKNYIFVGILILVSLILLFIPYRILFGKEFYFLIIFLFSILLTINLFIRFLEELPFFRKSFLYVFLTIISFWINLHLFNLAQHYPSINFLKPLANWFGIDY